MADEARDWDQLREDAIHALTGVADTEDGRHVSGDAEVLTDAVLAVFDAEALDRLGRDYVERSRLKSIGVEDGKVALDMVPAQEAIAGWCLAARGMLDGTGAENYTETSMEFADRSRGERYVFILQRVAPGKLTPHEARRKAEAEAERLRAALTALTAQLEANDACDA